jgi:hypothetical protein
MLDPFADEEETPEGADHSVALSALGDASDDDTFADLNEGVGEGFKSYVAPQLQVPVSTSAIPSIKRTIGDTDISDNARPDVPQKKSRLMPAPSVNPPPETIQLSPTSAANLSASSGRSTPFAASPGSTSSSSSNPLWSSATSSSSSSPAPVIPYAPLCNPTQRSHAKKRKKPRASIGRIQADDPARAALLSVAIHEFRAYVCAAEPYPEGTLPSTLALQSWNQANTRERPGLAPLPYDFQVETCVRTILFSF